MRQALVAEFELCRFEADNARELATQRSQTCRFTITPQAV